jgi:uncharacterized protein (TIGR00369 family)
MADVATRPAAFVPADPDFEARVRDSFARQPFMDIMGARLGTIQPGRVQVVLPFDPKVTQQHGFFHGGAMGAIADVAGGYAAFSLFPADATVLTVEYKINIMAPGKGERLVAEGDVLRSGRTLTVVRVDVHADADGRRIHCATGTQTLIRLDGKSDGKSDSKA